MIFLILFYLGCYEWYMRYVNVGSTPTAAIPFMGNIIKQGDFSMKKISNEEFNKAAENWCKNKNDTDMKVILDYCIQEGIIKIFSCMVPMSSISEK